jgi:hypothetical protein
VVSRIFRRFSLFRIDSFSFTTVAVEKMPSKLVGLPISLARHTQIQKLQREESSEMKRAVVSAGTVAQLTMAKNRARYPLH